MKNLLIKAYSNANLGDDLFIKILCERYPDHRFKLVASKSNSKAFNSIKNLKIIHPKETNNLVLNSLKSDYLNNKIAKESDATIYIGGSIFIQPKKKWELKVLRDRILVSNSKNFFILGANFGPYYNNRFINSYKKIFSNINNVSFRDKTSYNLFSEVPTASLAPDIVFNLNTDLTREFESTPYIVVSVIDLTNRPELKKYKNAYEKAIINITKALVEKKYKVILTSFCANEGDEQAINRILKNIGNNQAESFFYDGNINDSLSLIKSSSGVVATRFHSLVLGMVFDKPVFPFEYSKKTENLLNDMKFNGYHLSLNNLTDIDIEKVVEQLIEKKPQDITQERNVAARHFTKLDQFLNS